MFGGNPTAKPPWAGTARFVCALFACALAAGLPASAHAAGATQTKQGNARAEVLNFETVAKVKDMSFAYVAATTVARTVVLNPATNACTSTLVLVGACQAAEFDGFGTPINIVRIQINNNITLNGSNGGTMRLDNFSVHMVNGLIQLPGALGNPRYRIIAGLGLFTFRVGGTLNVGANQTPGNYTGTFDVTVRYQ